MLGFSLIGLLSISPAQDPSTAIAGRAKAASNYGILPLSFEENHGQAAQQVRYLARGAGYSILLDDSEAQLLLSRRAHLDGNPRQQAGPPLHSSRFSSAATDTLSMKLIGRNSRAPVSGESPLPGTVNYFAGNDPAKWLSGIPTFARVKYAGVYSGIDLTYYGNRQRLEFDFDLAPGADPQSIRLRFDGARKLRLDHDGNLIIVTANGQVGFEKPVIYQPTTRNGKQTVDGTFRILSGRTIAFTLGRYDRTKPLVIDPILNYSTYIGQSGQAYGIAVDAAGEAFVTGYAFLGMPTTAGIEPTPMAKVNPSDMSAFVAKLNSTGTAVLYCTYLSGSNSDEALALALDPVGNAYVAGVTGSANFPVTAGAYQMTYKTTTGTEFGPANGSGFVSAINSTGTALLYSTYLSGSTQTWITGIAVDSAGEAYVIGHTYDVDFPVTAGAFQTSPKGNVSQEATGFVTKLNAIGTSLAYSTYLGGNAGDYPNAITLDANNNAYIAGSTFSFDFPTTTGAFQRQNTSDNGNAFLTKLNSTGTAPVYSTYLGGNGIGDGAYAVAVDGSGDAYVTGYTGSRYFPITTGVFQPNLNLGQFPLAQNAFITKFNASGSSLVFSTYLGGSYNALGGAGLDVGVGIGVDSSGNIYVAGQTTHLDFPVTPGAFELQNLAQLNSGDGSTFLAKINPGASQILYATYLSGSGDYSVETCDCASGIALSPAGNVYIAGWTVSTDFPSTPGAIQTQMGAENAYAGPFVTEFNASEMTTLPNTTTTLTSSSTGQAYGQPVTFTATVTASSGNTPTGTVGFSVQGPVTNGEGDFSMGPWINENLNSSGAATFTTSSLITGQLAVNAYYLGDAKSAPSNGTMTETVTQIPTTTTVTSNENPAAYGSNLTLTATVVETATGNPAKGDVIFEVGSLAYADIGLNSAGQAIWATGGTQLPVGTTTVTASFGPASPILADQRSSGSIAETVSSTMTTPTPTFSPAAGTYYAAQDITFNDASTGAMIYYTEDGTTPVVGSSRQTPAGTGTEIVQSETIEAIAQAPGQAVSSIASATYVITTPPPDFWVEVSAQSLTVYPGGSGTATISVGAMNGFIGTVSFNCAGLASGATCSFSPSAVAPGSSASLTGDSTLTISASATGSSAKSRNKAGGSFLPAISFAAFVVWCGWFRRKHRESLLSALVIACSALLISLSACGAGSGTSGNGSGSTGTSTTSTLTITGTSGALTHSVTLDVTVL